jgi:hypothetical protein
MDRLERIRRLNDTLRKEGTGGFAVLTTGVASLAICKAEMMAAVAAFDKFDGDNDPHGEHDFGALELGGQRLFWKIDYYDPTLIEGSVDPSNPSFTERVLTVMLAEEY